MQSLIVIGKFLLVTYFQTIISTHNPPVLVFVRHAGVMTGWLFGCSAAKKLLEKYRRGKSWKQAPRKKKIHYQQNQWRQDPPGVGYTWGERGAQRHATPIGRSPALKPQWRWWHLSGQGEGEGGMGRLTCSQQRGKGKSITDVVLSILQSLLGGGEGTCPPKGCVSGTMGGEDARQRFSGPSPLLLWDCWRRRRVGAGAVCRELAFYSKGHIFSTEWKK